MLLNIIASRGGILKPEYSTTSPRNPRFNDEFVASSIFVMLILEILLGSLLAKVRVVSEVGTNTDVNT
jgi:hypothetical protein